MSHHATFTQIKTCKTEIYTVFRIIRRRTMPYIPVVSYKLQRIYKDFYCVYIIFKFKKDFLCFYGDA